MRAIFLNRFYWPDEPATAQLLTDLAEAIAAKGQEVVVLTSHPGRSTVPATETHRGVHLIRVRSTRWASRLGLAGKAVDLASFYVGMLWRLCWLARRGDVIVALTDPPFVGVGAWVVAGFTGARLMHWAQDIYPEVAVELGAPQLLNALRPLRDAAWLGAERCITLGRDMADVLAEAGLPAAQVAIAPNWAPTGVTALPTEAADALRAEWGLRGKFVVAYSGNLGRVHDLMPLLAVAAVLKGESSIVFLIIGSGAQEAALKAEASRLGLSNLQFKPPQPRSRLPAVLALGDVHVVTLRVGCERYVYPSKLVGVAAIGRPVLFIGPRTSEIAAVVEDVNGGFGRAFNREQIDEMAAAVRELAAQPGLRARLGQSALSFARGVGHAEAAASQWHNWLAPAPLS